MSIRTLSAATLSLCIAIVFPAVAQDAVPNDILQRTYAIQCGDEGGTAFGVDYQSRLYLVTARHVVHSLPERDGTIQVLRPEGMKTYHIARTLFPPSRDADIAVLETDEKVQTPFSIAITQGGEGPTMGQQVWFLGYPFRERLHSHFLNGELPFIKRGTMSAVDATNEDAIVLYIDGFNNEGFSGGPIVYWDFGKHAYRIVGVVQGYKPDAAKVVVNGQPVDTQILVNSGILVGFNIKHAIQAIEQANKK
jgi:hypothetical protein